MPANCLVIGVDFGTTYTSVAFRALTFDAEGNIIASQIHTVTSWPQSSQGQVPSEISYATGPGGERQWGYDISPNAPRLALMKLEFEHQERKDELQKLLQAVKGMETVRVSDIDQSNGLALSYSKSAEEIVKDFLIGVRETLLDDLRSLYSAAYLSTIPIDLVITVPVGWSEQAREQTLRAFRKAGFDSSNVNFHGLRKIIMMLEPEAAALHIIRSVTELEAEDTFRTGDCFIACDAGGGTVDLISYCIKETRPTLTLEEVGIATGARFGASYIDRDFKDWLRGKLGDENFQKLLPADQGSEIGLHTTITKHMQYIMRNFEAIKRDFDGVLHDTPGVHYIALPPVLIDMEDDPSRGIVDGDICITDEDLRAMFDPWVDGTLELLQSQIYLVKAEGFPVRHIFLCGGFGESRYLQARIKEFAKMRRIVLKVTEAPWLAVAHGAVIKGYEQGVQDSSQWSRSSFHYGVSTSQPFSEFKHSEEDAYTDPYDGEKKAAQQMTWLIKKGDIFSTAKPKIGSVEICRKFGVRDNRKFSLTVTACSDDYAPLRQADIHAGGATAILIDYDLSNIEQNRFQAVRGGANGQPYFCATLRIEIEMQLQSSIIRVLMDGHVINSVVGNH